MNEEPTTEAGRLAKEARELAEQAADEIGTTRADDDAAVDQDVEREIGHDVDPHPGGDDARGSGLTGAGAPMP